MEDSLVKKANSCFKFLERIGMGQFGKVYKCSRNGSSELVAVKWMELRNLSTDPIERLKLEKILYEVRVMRLLPHPNIIEILDVKVLAEGGDRMVVMIVMPLMTESLNSTFLKLAIAHELRPVSLLWEFRPLIFQIFNGLKALHSKGVVHRDVKMDNIFFSESNQGVVLGDLGWAREVANIMTKKVVCLYYKAPELLTKDPRYGCGIDIWAVGCILAQILLRRVLFDYLKLNKDPETNQRNLLMAIAQAVPPLSPEDVAFLPPEEQALALQKSVEPSDIGRIGDRLRDAWAGVSDPQDKLLVTFYIDLTLMCLQFDPSKRLSAAKALEHDLFAGLQAKEGDPTTAWENFDKTLWSNDSNGVQQMCQQLLQEALKISQKLLTGKKKRPSLRGTKIKNFLV